MRWASSTATCGTDIAPTPRSRSPVAGALAGGERAAEEAVEDRPGDALDEGELVGALDLALDLGLAEDHRVEAGGDAEELGRGLGAVQRVEVADSSVGRMSASRASTAERLRLGRDRIGREEVELGAVAGRDRRRLADLVGLGELADHAGGAALRKREPLAQLERRGLVGDAEGEELAHAGTSCALGLGLRIRGAALREIGQLAQLAVDAGEPRPT